eukprot:2873284-Prymnesium_polylepis.1
MGRRKMVEPWRNGAFRSEPRSGRAASAWRAEGISAMLRETTREAQSQRSSAEKARSAAAQAARRSANRAGTPGVGRPAARARVAMTPTLRAIGIGGEGAA